MSIPNREQIEHWNNGDEVGHWIDQQTRHDEMLAPFIDILLAGAQLRSGDRVLDVGCGCGATTMAAARMTTPGTTVGIDLSAPMLERARTNAKAANVDRVAFLQGDAQTHSLDGEVFDAVISRFGIMFFDDPVAAFANVRKATRQKARLAFVCWQPLIENEWLLVPGAALAQHVTLPEVSGPGGPGMFAFADPDEPKRVLDASGWSNIAATDTRIPMYVGGHGTVADAVEFLRTGPIGRTVLAGIDPNTEGRALDAVRAVLEPHHDGVGVRLEAAVWLLSATN